MPTLEELEAQIAALTRQLADIDPPPARVCYAVGDRLRVIGDSRAGPKAPHLGDVGTVLAVTPKREAMTVYMNAVKVVYLLDFGPDDDRLNGRDTWGYADGDVQAADAPFKKQRRKPK